MIRLVQVHNAARDPVLSTEATLKMLPGKACLGFRRDSSGEVIVADGWVECETENPGLLAFAVANQGYAKAVKEP